jgi:hypothetical protein
MADPAVWHDLRSAFQQLASNYGDRLRPSWRSTPWDHSGDHWHVFRQATDDVSERDLFIKLAKRAGIHLGGRGQINPLFAWLDYLRSQSANFTGGHAEGHVGELEFGTIERPCQASIHCCYDLETGAMNRPDQEALTSGNRTPEGNLSSTSGPPLEPARAARKKRGRPTEISDDLKEKALGVKGGKERAKILYQTRYPTVQQVKNVPTLLKHYSRKRQSKAQ